MEDRLRSSIARIDVVRDEKSLSRGTGTLVHERFVLTALHVVADRHQTPPMPYPGTIVLEFPGHRTEATIYEDRLDPFQDWVILECAEPPPALPVPMAELDRSGGEFTTFGFPDSQPVDGMVQTGSVESHVAELNRVPVFQLFSKQAAAGDGAPVKGLSGGPMLVDGALVGVLRFALMKDQKTVAGTLYACPVSAVLERCSDFLPIPDPVWGLPGLPRRDLPVTPFRSLHYFEARHAEIFFGRNREIRHLYDSITDEGGPKLVLFYGQSGVGKSSFLAAGLEPRLEWSHETLYLRRDETTSPLDQMKSSLAGRSRATREEGALPPAPSANLNPVDALQAARLRIDESIERSLEELDRLEPSAMGEASRELETRLRTIRSEFEQQFEKLVRTMWQPPPEPAPGVAASTEPERPAGDESEPAVSPEPRPPERTLVEVWREAEEAAGRPIVVIFDQLEEVLIHPDAVRRRDLETLIAELRNVVSEGAGVRGSVILSFRKEWLSEVLRVIERHDVPHAKAFLQGLDSEAIVEVVTGLTRTRRLRQQYGLKIDSGLPEKIAQDLSDDPESPVAPALQILLTRMWKRATAASASEPVFSHELYRELAREGLLLGSFLDQQLEKLGGAAHSGLALDVLAFHTTGRMTARERALQETVGEYAHVADEVRRLVDDL
ncbi:MAG: trypsin-like peptidase domain-containing protein, partial [Thermoanaerobaculia bacterium]|nr:trypsin-like peptidase domain-containing protein [Thermoanaerobaculia bacterium]